MSEPRYCSNCRAELPAKADACPACGVFAGDLYDERTHRPKSRVTRFGGWLIVILIAAGVAVWWNARSGLTERKQIDVPRTRVVKDRPGGAKRGGGAVVNQAEAIRLVRRHVVVTLGVKNECLVLLGEGFQRGQYVIAVRDHCANTSLGKWRVDGKSGQVTR